MDLKVRGIEPKYVAEIDRKRKMESEKTGKKISQNDYLKSLIRNDYERQLWEYKQDMFDKTLEKFVQIVDSQNVLLMQQTVKIEQLTKVISTVFFEADGGEE